MHTVGFQNVCTQLKYTCINNCYYCYIIIHSIVIIINLNTFWCLLPNILWLQDYTVHSHSTRFTSTAGPTVQADEKNFCTLACPIVSVINGPVFCRKRTWPFKEWCLWHLSLITWSCWWMMGDDDPRPFCLLLPLLSLRVRATTGENRTESHRVEHEIMS